MKTPRKSPRKPATKTKTKTKPKAKAKAKTAAPKTAKPTPAERPLEIDPEVADAAAEVLEAVFLSEKNFDLENKIVRAGDGQVVAERDAEGHVWVTVKLHVPMLDIDTWIDGTHLDHPDNQIDRDGVDP
ncbi:MAG TPA: hypothetical protein VLE97_07385 [Gaiellaceae bacterium]|nr:hypothetical protein [Gaiellaceae bacterium]